MISVDDIVLMLILTFFVVGFGLGVIISFAQRCNYCGGIIIVKKTNIRLPYEYGFVFIPYHRKCYMKYKNVEKNQIVS